MDPILFIVLAVALGFKHSYDADHLVAVSNFLARSTSLRKTTLMSMSWAAGHMATASIITVLLYFGREVFFPRCSTPGIRRGLDTDRPRGAERRGRART